MCVYSINVSVCPTMILKKINPNTDCLVRPLSNFNLIPYFGGWIGWGVGGRYFASEHARWSIGNC